MTKTEYRKYISSPYWLNRRKQFLVAQGDITCFRCSMPRWLAIIVYDQDIHVHHLSYANLGHEQDSDLIPLCRRCHQIETFGYSPQKAPWSAECSICGMPYYDPFLPDQVCRECAGNCEHAYWLTHIWQPTKLLEQASSLGRISLGSSTALPTIHTEQSVALENENGVSNDSAGKAPASSAGIAALPRLW